MIELIYTSKAVGEWDAARLNELLNKAWRKNRELEVTGLLIYNSQHFLQVLEGDPAVIRELYRIIGEDTRHTDVVTLVERQRTSRSFSEWSMGSVNLDCISHVDPDVIEQFAAIAARVDLPPQAVVRWFERVVEHHRADISVHA